MIVIMQVYAALFAIAILLLGGALACYGKQLAFDSLTIDHVLYTLQLFSLLIYDSMPLVCFDIIGAKIS